MKPLIPFLFYAIFSIHTIQAQYSLHQLDSLLALSPNIEQANMALQKAALQFGTEDSLYARFCYYKGMAFWAEMQKDSAFRYYEKARIIQEKHYKKHPDYAQTLVAIASYYNNEKEQYADALKYLQKAQGIQASTLGKTHLKYHSTTLQIANTYRDMGQYEIAESNYISSIAGIKAANGTQNINYAKAINSLANLYKLMAKYDQAALLYKEALTFTAQVEGKESSTYATLLNNLSNIYRSLKNTDAAIELQEEAIALKKKIYGTNHPEYAMSLNNLAAVYFQLSKIDEAIALFQEASAIYKKSSGEESYTYAMALQNLGSMYYWKDDCSTAMDFYAKALSIKEKVHGKKHQIYLEGLNNLLDILSYCRSFDETWVACSEAIELNTGIPLPSDTIIDQAWADSILQADILWTDILLYSLYYVYYLEKDNKTLSPEARQEGMFITTKLALQLLEKSKNEFNSEGDKLRVLKDNLYWISYLLTLAQKSPAMRMDAFRAAEQNKSILLMDIVKNAHAYSMGKLPDSLAIQEQQLLTKKDGLQAALANPNKIINKDSLLTALNALKIEMDLFKKRLEKEYPSYHELKYAALSTEASKIQSYLSEERLFLEYFLDHDTAFYVFVISPEDLELFHIPIHKDSFAEHISQFRKSLSDYKFIKEQEDEAYKLYTSYAYKIYQTILEPILKGRDKIKKLIISTDGALGHLPFEALLSEAVTEKRPWSKLPYLLHQYHISYTYSATLWQQNRERQTKGNGRMLAFAASYNGEKDTLDNSTNRAPHLQQLRDILLDLPSAKEEVLALSQRLQGQFLLGQAASEAAFKTEAGNYGVIHLAMHGLLDSKNPILSSLAFTENGDLIEDNFLEAWEISHLNLNAELVVLSACETGYGRFEQGEGVMSLARAFMYAGTPALVVSLWQVNDESTSYIMQKFYQKLAQGLPKDEALQQAKLVYLKHAKGITAHPAFWAPFIQLGDSRPIKLRQKISSYWLWAIGGVGSLALIAGGLAMRRRGRKEAA